MAETATHGILTATKSKPGQWKILIPLVGVLVFLNAYGGEEDDSEKETAAQSASSSDTSARPHAQAVRRDISWPEVPLEFLLTNNPFHPDVDDVAEDDTTDAQSEEVSSSGGGRNAPPVADLAMAKSGAMTAHSMAGKKVTMVFRGAHGTGAMIDGKVYHEGDRIGKFEIVRIARDGVTLRPAAAAGRSYRRGARRFCVALWFR